MFKITDHIEFDPKGRAACPVCTSDKGKTNKNLSLIPNTDGAYKCHRGCSPEDIRQAIGQPKHQILPTAIAKSIPITYHPKLEIDANNHRLLNDSIIGKRWLIDRGISLDLINKHRLGVAPRRVSKYEQGKVIDSKNLPCITIPYEYAEGYLQKYFVAPWLSSEERLDTRVLQDSGIASRFWFTKKSQSTELWICEGEWDAILCSELVGDRHIDICTSTTGAGNAPKDLTDLEQYIKIYIWYDLDDAGKVGSQKMGKALGSRAAIATVPHPEDYIYGWDISDAILGGFKFEDFDKARDNSQSLDIEPVTKAEVSKKSLRSLMTTNAELLARAKDYTDWLIEEILPIDELILIAASPRAGKSLMAMNMAYAIATGTNFMDRPVTQGPVFYVHCEDSETKIKMRQIAQGWDADLPVYWFEKFKLSQLAEMIELAQEMQPRLIILDTLSRIRDDNSTESSAEMGRILEPLQEFAREHNCCVLLVHHTGKIKIDNVDTLDVFETIRGSSAIRATCRGTVVIAANETGYRMCIENGYIKQDLKVSLNLSDLTWRAHGKWLTQTDGSQGDQVMSLLAKLEKATLEQLHDQTEINKGSLYKVLSRLTQEGKISKTGSRKAVVYSRLLAKLPRNISDISDMSDMLSDSQTHTPQVIEVMSDKSNISFLLDNNTVEKSTHCGEIAGDHGHNFNNCLTSASNIDTPSVTESDNISDKPVFVRHKIGDQVEILTGQQYGKIAKVIALEGDEVEVMHKNWAFSHTYPTKYLKLKNKVKNDHV